jgi:hypothetical protein
MAADLFKDDFSRLSSSEVFQAIETFTRMSEPIQNRPRESFVLDFKAQWVDSALCTVAAFAHAFGGLLIVGVSEKDAQPDQLVGVESAGELKTSIASSIATNISPPPSYEIAECSLPTTPARKLAVIRVRQGNRIHYLTKKGVQPIYVRNEDESKPADAEQLRSLIERKQSPSESRAEAITRIASTLASVQLHANEGELATQLQILLVPFGHPGVILDSAEEQQLRKLINGNFSFRYKNSQYSIRNDRAADWYQYGWLRPADKHESVWRITSEGDMGYARQIRVSFEDGELYWSLGDTLADLLLLLAVARSWWKNAGFYGEAHLVVSILAHNLTLHAGLVTELSPDSPGKWAQMLNFDSTLEGAIVSPSIQPSPTGNATGIFNSGLPYDAATDLVAEVLNQLLRSMRHSADLNGLKSAVEIFVHAHGV